MSWLLVVAASIVLGAAVQPVAGLNRPSRGVRAARVIGGSGRGRSTSGRRASRRRRGGPRSGRGGPTWTTSSWAPALQASVRPISSAPHSARLVARMAAGELRGHLLGERLGLGLEPLRWVDDLAQDAELVGPLGGDPLVPADQRHPQDRLGRRLPHERDVLVGGHLADRDVRVEEAWRSTRRSRCRHRPRSGGRHRRTRR